MGTLNHIAYSTIRYRNYLQKLHEEREKNRLKSRVSAGLRLQQENSMEETIITLASSNLLSTAQATENMGNTFVSRGYAAWPHRAANSLVNVPIPTTQPPEVVVNPPQSIPYPEDAARIQTNKKTGREYGLSPNMYNSTIKLHKEDKEVKLVFDKHPYVYNYELPSTGLEVSIIKSPTGNCQSYCISDFNFLVEEENGGGAKILDSLEIIHKRIRKPLLALDVKYNIAPRVRELFENEIVHETKYISTSGSAMYSFLVKTYLLET